MQAPGFSPERVASLRLISSGGAGVSDAFVDEAERGFGAQREAHVRLDRSADRSITDGARDRRTVELRVDDETASCWCAAPRCASGYLDPRRTPTRSPPTAGSAPATSRRSTPTALSRSSAALKDVDHPRRREHQHRRSRSGARGAPRRPARRRRRRARRAHGRAGRARSSSASAAFDLEACRAWFAGRGVAQVQDARTGRRGRAAPAAARPGSPTAAAPTARARRHPRVRCRRPSSGSP